MAIGWWTALRVIPWGDVIEHAPAVLKGARRLMERQRGETPPPEPVPPVTAVEAPPDKRLAQVEASLAELQTRLATLAEQQRQGDELLAALAEQNARLVETVEVLRQRSRLLAGVAVVLAAGGLALAWRVLGA